MQKLALLAMSAAACGRTTVVMQVYLDSVMVQQVAATSVLELHVPASSGTHRIAVKSWYSDGSANLSATATVTVL